MFVKISNSTAVNSDMVGYIMRDDAGVLYVSVNGVELQVDSQKEGVVSAALDVHGMNI